METVVPEPDSGAPFAPPDPAEAVRDRRGLRVLGMQTCLERLREVHVGRVAYPDGGSVVVLPVNHVVDGDTVVFRTTWGSKLHRASDGGAMSYEVDDHDVETRSGWSVLVTGRAQIVRGDDADRLDAMAPPSWTPFNDVSWVRIRAEEISGRQIDPVSPAVTSPQGVVS